VGGLYWLGVRGRSLELDSREEEEPERSRAGRMGVAGVAGITGDDEDAIGESNEYRLRKGSKSAKRG
jgi:hypothetical protein